MLLLVKGRRHVQLRLVEPSVSSINEGDAYVLVTPDSIYVYLGKYSNVIEQSRANSVANHIQQKSDLGCKAKRIITIHVQDDVTEDSVRFWKLIGGLDERNTIAKAGHPEEDELYESHVLNTNMIYDLIDKELVPADCWGTMPKIEMLESNKVFVFDFGSEMYVWSGKNAPIDDKKIALKLAKDIWNEGMFFLNKIIDMQGSN